MERVADYTERLRRQGDITDFMFYCFLQARYPIGPNGQRDAFAMTQAINQSGRPRVERILHCKGAVGGGTTQSGNWGENITELQNVASEWRIFTQAKTFLGKLPYVRVPFVTRTGLTSAPEATFVGAGVGITPAGIASNDSNYLKRTRVATIAVVTNELVRVWAPGTRENLDALLTRSVVRGMDRAALDPDVAAVTDERPASLLNGVAPIGLLGSTVSAVLAQIRSLVEALIAGGSDLDQAMFAMHPIEAVRLSSLVTTEGVPAFPRLTATGGDILGIPVAVSVGCQRAGSPSERVVALIDGAQILVADDGGIDVTASSQATMQMVDTTSQDARAGTGSTLVSIWQTDSTAIKVGRTINYERAQDAAVAWLSVTG